MTTSTALRTITWTGKSGLSYTYYIYPFGTPFEAKPGNYIFASETGFNSFTPIYFGETEDLSERFDYHHKMPCILRNRATHVHVHLNERGVLARQAEERDLILRWSPTCNAWL